jgi:mercuric ion transport protein
MKIENISSIGTVAVTFLAASCCIGPAIFVVFGVSVGFLGKLAFLEKYRSVFMLAAAAMLSFSFWKLYLKKADCDCKEDERKRKIARGIFWVGVIAFVSAMFFPTMLLWLYA